MYNMNIKDNRVEVQINHNINGKFSKLLCVFDTGAKFTAIQDVSIKIRNLNATNIFYTGEDKMLSGFVSSGDRNNKLKYSILFHKVIVSKLSISNIVFNNIPIWVTFDKRATNDVLGMNIISKLYTFIGDGEVYITNNRNELIEFMKNDRLVLRTDLPSLL